MVTPDPLSGPELDVQSNDGTVPTETNPENGQTVSGKQLSQPNNGYAIVPGAIRDLAFKDIASDISGSNTLPDANAPIDPNAQLTA